MEQLSLKQSQDTLTCALAGNTANIVRIMAASASAQSPTAGDLKTTIAGDGQSFTVPLNRVGTWAVVAVVNLIPKPPSPVLQTGNNEALPDGTVLPAGTFLDFFDDPATLAAVFTLEVMA